MKYLGKSLSVMKSTTDYIGTAAQLATFTAGHSAMDTFTVVDTATHTVVGYYISDGTSWNKI